jgi:mono/diheme cytochrome c family protein
MRQVPRAGRVTVGPIAVVLPALLVALGSCSPQQDSGFDKVAARSHAPIAAAAMPDPPPFVAGLAGPAAATPIVAADLPTGVTQEMVDEGQQLYGTVCVACHGAGGVGGPVGPALNDQDWIHIAGDFEGIVNIIDVGVAQPRQFPAPMPPQGGGSFTPDQLRAIGAYVYALSRAGT